MNKHKMLLIAITLGTLCLAGSAMAAEPEGSAVMRIVTIQTADVRTYAHELSVEEGMLRRVGINCAFKVWQAQFAGPESGTIIVQLQFPSFEMFARYLDAGRTHPELLPQFNKFNPSLRKIVSDSIYREVPAS
jgi:hypothetical protein